MPNPDGNHAAGSEDFLDHTKIEAGTTTTTNEAKEPNGDTGNPASGNVNGEGNVSTPLATLNNSRVASGQNTPIKAAGDESGNGTSGGEPDSKIAEI